MNKTISALALIAWVALATPVLLSSCGNTKAASPDSPKYYAEEQLTIEYDQPIVYENLLLYPITAANAIEPMGDYLSLSEAIEKEKVEISEKSVGGNGGDEVNKLFIENLSNDTVMMLAGEVVKGGKQDRTLATDVVLAPKSGKYDVQVFCVEQHRWQPKEENQVLNKPQEAMKFKACAPVVKNSIRKEAVVSKQQGKVWEEVSSSNVKAQVVTVSDAYTAIEDNVVYQNTEKNYKALLIKKLQEDKHIIGFIAVTDQRVLGCDVFPSNQLFRAELSTILPSYINEVVHDGKKPILAQDSVKHYAERLFRSAKTQAGYVQNHGYLFVHKGRGLHLNTY